MKDKLLRITFFYFVFILIIIAIDNNSYKNDISYSLTSDDVRVSIISDRHVLPGEKVFLDITGDISDVKTIQLDLSSKKELFTVDVYNINNKAYFILPEYGNNVIVGDTYRLDAVKVVYDNDILDIYSINNKIDGYKNYKDDSFIIVDDSNGDPNIWRDFNNLSIINNTIDDYGHVYIDLYADTSSIVSIMVILNSDTDNIIGYVENLDNRPYISFDEELEIGTYKIDNIVVYYNDGISVNYSTNKKDDNYLDIGDNKINVDKIIIVSSAKNIEEVDTTSTVTKSNKDTKELVDYLWIVLLVVLVIAALVLFYYLKTEDDED